MKTSGMKVVLSLREGQECKTTIHSIRSLRQCRRVLAPALAEQAAHYVASAFQTFGGDMGSSVRRFPIA